MGTKIPHGTGQLNLGAATTEPMCCEKKKKVTWSGFKLSNYIRNASDMSNRKYFPDYT